MASEYIHKEKYRHNKFFSQSKVTSNVPDEEFDDWKVVGMFYAGLHIIETVLVKDYNIHSEDHADRDNNLRRCAFNEEVRAEYRNLKVLASKIRYDDFYPTNNEFISAQASLTFLERKYKKYIG